MVHNLFAGLTSLGNVDAVLWLVAGSFIGLVIGVIPGLGGAVVMSIVVAFAYKLSLTGVLCLFLAVHAGSYYSASITSILLNVPAHPEAFAVTLDGFPMAQKGQAGRALGLSAVSTFIGGLIGCVILVGLLQAINYLATAFHPPEFAALITLALILVGTLGTDAVSKGLLSAGLGVVIASIGSSYVTSVTRYTFGSPELLDGVNLVALVLGALAIPQMILMFGTGTRVSRQDLTGRELADTSQAELGEGFRRQSFLGVAEALRHGFVLVRSAVVGVIIGVVPGIGGFTANFLSYAIAEQSSKKRKLFGTGLPEGIIAAEASSLAKEAGGLVPLFGLGIPGGVGSALFLAALAVKNVDPGFGFTQQFPVVTYEAVWIIALAGLVGTVGGLLLTPALAQVTKAPGLTIVPFVMALAVIGTFAAEVSVFVVIEMVVFMVVGFVLRRLRYSLPALVIGLVLGTTFESNVYQTTQVYPHGSFLWKQPAADVLFAIAIGVVVLRAVQGRRQSKRERPEAESVGMSRAMRRRERRRRRPRQAYPLLSLVTSGLLLAVGLYVLIYGLTHYDHATVLMPAIGGSVISLCALWRLPGELRAYLRSRRPDEPGGEAERGDLPVPAEPVLVESVPVGGGASALAADEPLPAPAVPDTVMVGREQAAPSGVPAIVEKAWGWTGQYTRELLAFGWFAGLVVACYLFGFAWGVPLFMALYGLAATKRVFASWPSRVIFAVASAAVMWSVAYVILSVLLNIIYAPVVSL
jgi:putative tricarboxylic transport membrane protein